MNTSATGRPWLTETNIRERFMQRAGGGAWAANIGHRGKHRDRATASIRFTGRHRDGKDLRASASLVISGARREGETV